MITTSPTTGIASKRYFPFGTETGKDCKRHRKEAPFNTDVLPFPPGFERVPCSVKGKGIASDSSISEKTKSGLDSLHQQLNGLTIHCPLDLHPRKNSGNAVPAVVLENNLNGISLSLSSSRHLHKDLVQLASLPLVSTHPQKFTQFPFGWRGNYGQDAFNNRYVMPLGFSPRHPNSLDKSFFPYHHKCLFRHSKTTEAQHCLDSQKLLPCDCGNPPPSAGPIISTVHNTASETEVRDTNMQQNSSVREKDQRRLQQLRNWGIMGAGPIIVAMGLAIAIPLYWIEKEKEGRWQHKKRKGKGKKASSWARL